MKTMKEIAEQNITSINESKVYDDIIEKLTNAKESGMPLNEGLFGALVGGVAGMTIAPVIMKTLCNIIGVDPKGQFGSILTSRLVLTALCTKMGWNK